MTGRFLFLTLTIYQIRINGSQGSGKKITQRHQKRQNNRTSATTVDCSVFCTVVSLVTYYWFDVLLAFIKRFAISSTIIFRRERGVYTVNAANPFHDY